MKETERIKIHYKERLKNDIIQKTHTYDLFIKNMKEEREAVYRQLICSHFKTPSTIKVMEIGAGAGGNIPFFKGLEIDFKNIFTNELMEERAAELKSRFPDVTLFEGDALQLNFANEFDLVFQSTVFTSILDNDLKVDLGTKMWEMTKTGGFVLWYDFKYNNPRNKSVKGISKTEVRSLFPEAKKIIFYNVTLAPPIGRRFQRIYKLINTLFPFLKTHIVAAIYK